MLDIKIILRKAWKICLLKILKQYTNRGLEKSLEVLMELHERKCYPPFPFLWNEKLPQEVKLQFVKRIKNLDKVEGLSEVEIIRSLDVGGKSL